VGINDYKFGLPFLQVQLYTLSIFLAFLVIIMQFLLGKIAKEIDSIVVCQRNRTGYRL